MKRALFSISASGSVSLVKGAAAGGGTVADIANMLEKEYKEGMTVDEAKALAVKCMDFANYTIPGARSQAFMHVITS